MSNGILEEAKRIIESKEIPQSVSNRLVLAAIIEGEKKRDNLRTELIKKIEDNKAGIEENANDINDLQASDKRWGGIAVMVSAVITFVGAVFGRDL